jgi:hypothetical protein
MLWIVRTSTAFAQGSAIVQILCEKIQKLSEMPQKSPRFSGTPARSQGDIRPPATIKPTCNSPWPCRSHRDCGRGAAFPPILWSGRRIPTEIVVGRRILTDIVVGRRIRPGIADPTDYVLFAQAL